MLSMQTATPGRLLKWSTAANVLTIADSGRGLVNSDFILGESGGELDTIGSFGAGLLDAVAVLKKDGCVLKVESYKSVFTFPTGNADGVIHLKEETAATCKPGTKWTIYGNFKLAEVQDAIQNFLIFNPTKPFIRYDGLEVYNTRGEEGRLYISGMRMNGVNPLCFHYNFTEKDTRKYGREHQVSNDLFNKELKILIAPIYQRFPERFYDALQLAHPKCWPSVTRSGGSSCRSSSATWPGRRPGITTSRRPRHPRHGLPLAAQSAPRLCTALIHSQCSTSSTTTLPGRPGLSGTSLPTPTQSTSAPAASVMSSSAGRIRSPSA